MLLYSGDEGTGKGIGVIDFMGKSIIGRRYSFFATDLKRFIGKFSAHRANKILVVFNECLDVTKGNSADFDKVKSMITDTEYAHEAKHKSVHMREENSAFVFLSNWATCVRIGNGDRRYAIMDINDEKKGDHEYFQTLAAAMADKRVQVYWFNFLIRRDLTNWQRRKIPETEAKERLKEDSGRNLFLRYLKLMVTGEITGWFREDSKECDHWYRMKTVREHFRRWVKKETGKVPHLTYTIDKVLERAGKGWAKLGLSQHPWKTRGLYKKKVRDRSRRCDGDSDEDEPPFDGPERDLWKSKQRVCYKFNKEIVKGLHVSLLNSPDWSFDTETPP